MSTKQQHVFEVVIRQVTYRSIYVWAESQKDAIEQATSGGSENPNFIEAIHDYNDLGPETFTARRNDEWFGPGASTRDRPASTTGSTQ